MAIGGVVEPNADVAVAESAVDACSDTPVSCLSREELSARLAAIVVLTAKLDALRVETVRAADAVDVGQLTGQRNTANHVASKTNADPSTIRADQRIARWLDDLPDLAEAYRLGRIHTEHIELLRLADNPRVHTQLVADQDAFVEYFTKCNFRDLRLVIDR